MEISVFMVSLEQIPFFTGLSKAELQQLKEDIFIRYYEENSIVFYEGDQSRYLHILLEGSVSLYKTSPNGTKIHIHTLHAPNMIAEYTTFQQTEFPVTCEVIKEGKIGLLHIEGLYENIKNPVFSLEFIRSLSQKMMILFKFVHNETIFSAEAKLANLIIQEPLVFNHLKNNEIAAILNVTPETLSRILGRFKRKGIIAIEEHQLMVLDQQKLDEIMETNRSD